jgi:Tfp pilus assembly protein PilF
VPFIVLAAATGGLTLLAQHEFGAIMSTRALPISIRVGNAVQSYLNYIGKTIWPANLAVPYPYPRAFYMVSIAVTALVLAMLSVGIIRQARIRPYLVTGWLWYIVTLVPVIGLLQAGEQAMADRYTYLPLIGLFVMAAWGMTEVAVTRPQKLLSTLAAATILTAILWSARVQIGYWKDSEVLFSHTVEVTHDNPVAHFLLGFAFAGKGKNSEAAAEYAKAVELRPTFSDAENNWGLALNSLGQVDEAIQHFQSALRSEPSHALAHANLGEALLKQGNLDPAMEHLKTSLQLDPHNSDAHHQMALALSRQGQIEEAFIHYQESIRLDPVSVGTLNDLAWLLATGPNPGYRNGQEAVRVAERGRALIKQPPPILLGTLAAAYAEAGRFAEATNMAQEAITRANAAGQKEIAATNQKLLQLYRASKPYHEGELPKL